MVRCFLGHKAGSKYFKKDTMTSLMNGLVKHNHPVVKGLSESALNKRIKVEVDAAKEMTQSSDREKLAKLKDNGNENNVDTGDNLDAYDKCILELAIQEEKLTSAKKEDEERKKANQQDQSARLQAVSKVCSRVDVADNTQPFPPGRVVRTNLPSTEPIKFSKGAPNCSKCAAKSAKNDFQM
jgi:hypothetical protein